MRLARPTVLATVLALLAAPLRVEAQAQPVARVTRIGIVFDVLPVAEGVKQPYARAFLGALREAGYEEGRSIRFEYRSTEGRLDRVPDIVAELVRLGVDVIVTTTNPVALRVKQATTTVPIVMGTSWTPVEVGLVQSLSRPGGNVTGLTVNAGAESEATRLELLREVAPKITRVAYIGSKKDWEDPIGKEVQSTAQRLGLTLVLADYPPSPTPADYPAAFRVVLRVPRAEAVFPVARSPSFTYQRMLVNFTGKNRLPAVHLSRQFAAEGGLMAYGPSLPDLYRRAAGYVDRILKGANPGDLPVEQPTKFDLVINLKTAKVLGLTIPPAVLARADELIE